MVESASAFTHIQHIIAWRQTCADKTDFDDMSQDGVPARQMQLHDTMSRRKRPFTPIDTSNVRLYACGPTVYDAIHIGNGRMMIVFDVLFRLLRQIYGTDHVTYVRNITDVDDKINIRALRDFPDLPLNEAICAVTEKTTPQFQEDVLALGCLVPTFEPRATAHIDGMIAMIGTLIARGHAYVAMGEEGAEVLFDVTSMPDYGALSGRDLDEQQAGARVAVAQHKRHPADFVLWKQSGDDAPGWEASLDGTTIYGRPGWHIECSVMSAHHLGEVFDIHGGGQDLIFPHHENEIAQSRCAHATPTMANIWMHNGYLQVEGQKMAKSAGNFFTVRELLEQDRFGGRAWPGEVLRMAMLMTHYREPIDFSVRRLKEADALLARLWRRAAENVDNGDADSVVNALCDDLNTVDAIQVLSGLSGSPLRAGLSLLGLPEVAPIGDVDLDSVQVAIDRRLALIADKNWAEADRIRDELLDNGIQLKDGKDPDTGARVTTWEVRR